MKRYLLIVFGGLALGLGILGILLPILPTTPFLLISAACFLKSSQRLYNWLMDHKILGPYIRNYTIHKAIAKKTKYVSLITLWACILVSVIFFAPFLWLKILLLLIALGVSLHIIRFKTLTKEMLIQTQLEIEQETEKNRSIS